jgi:hypothetical protein
MHHPPGNSTILTSQKSCNFFWGSAWVKKSFDALEEAEQLISEIEKIL